MNKLKPRVIFESARKKSKMNLNCYLFACFSVLTSNFLFFTSRSFLCAAAARVLRCNAQSMREIEQKGGEEKSNKKKKLVSNLINFYLHFSVFTLKWFCNHNHKSY